MPAMPPPTTMTAGLTGTSMGSSGWLNGRRWICALRMRLAFSVASSLSSVTQRAVLAHVGHLEQERVEAGVGGRLAEGGLVHRRRAGRHDHAVHAELLDVFLDQVLAGVGAHVLVLARDHHVGLLGRPGGDLLDVDLAGDVAAAVAEVDGDLLVSHVRLLLAAHAGIAATTRSQETTCLSMASCLGVDAERQAGELREVHHRDVEVRPEGLVDARLVALEVHLAERAGADDDVGAGSAWRP